MENVLKKIGLECAKNRFYGNYMPALDSETLSAITNEECWGDFPYDVIIESGDTFDIFSLRNNLPLLYDNGHYVFRFGNIAHLYGWLNRIARETVFYKYAVRRGQYKWIEVEQEFFDSGITFEMYSTLPSTYSGVVCEVIGVHSEADTFNAYFRSSGVTARYELNFKNFVDNIFSGAKDYTFKPPFLDLPLTITEDVNSIGDLLSDEQDWVENKKYYLGDIVRHENEYYVLEKGEKYSIFKASGKLYTIIEEAYSSSAQTSGYTFINNLEEMPKTWEETSGSTYILVQGLTGPFDFSYVQVYYKGEYDENTRLTSFDDEEHSHWKKIEPELYESGDTDEDIVIASNLDTFRSVRKSYDVDGNELPFNVIESGETYLVALIYNLGYTNYSLKENGACVDYLKRVTFMRDLSDSGDTIEYDGECKDIIISDKLDEGYSYIKFGYYLGCNVVGSDDEQEADENTGIYYEETRAIDTVTEKIKYSGTDETEFTYFILSNITEESKKCNPNKACAKVVYNRKIVDSIPFHVFSNSRLFGSTFVEGGKDYLQISRGTYAAFERHNILGEINSMDDLKNYRNNYFKL